MKRFPHENNVRLHQPSALTIAIAVLGSLMSTAEKGRQHKRSRPEVRWVIGSERGDPSDRRTRKNRRRCETTAGARNRESGDRTKGCDGTCVHAGGSLAGVGG